ncbi:MAG: signal peptidase I [Pseudanabaenales cyanobacterium]|nr:signal peptidase I [Pseudanabaenales cyanobacterium]
MSDNPNQPQLSNSDESESQSAAQAKPATKPQNSQNPWIEGFQTIGLSIVLALGIRHFVAEARYIPSGSMEPTLQINDRLVVEKVSYYFNPPERGDIVVFWPPDELFPNTGRRDAFIKRVIGLPGETVQIEAGNVIVDGRLLEEEYIKAPPEYQWGPETVPPYSYLVLGDNRNSSYDSHSWGFVPQKNIIGRAVVRFWPPDRVGGLN